MSVKITPADKAFADCLKTAHDYTCERCGKEGRMETSHVLSRRHRTNYLRWDEQNANCLCHYCHRIWHESPLEANKWFIDKYGEERMDMLIEKKNSRIKVSKTEEPQIAKHYRNELKQIQEKRNGGQTGYIQFVSYQ